MAQRTLPPSTYVSAFCQNADAVENGTLACSRTPDELRRMCRSPKCVHPWHQDNGYKADDLEAALTSEAHVRLYNAKAAAAAAREIKNTERPERSATPSRPTSGRCEHCGEQTRGGKFVAGHDAKLKGDLLRAARDGDSKAYCEMLIRNWVKPSHADTIPTRTINAGTKLLDSVATGDWLAQQIAARIGQ